MKVAQSKVVTSEKKDLYITEMRNLNNVFLKFELLSAPKTIVTKCKELKDCNDVPQGCIKCILGKIWSVFDGICEIRPDSRIFTFQILGKP